MPAPYHPWRMARAGAGKQFPWLGVSSVKAALSHPAHAPRRVTQAVGRLLSQYMRKQ